MSAHAGINNIGTKLSYKVNDAYTDLTNLLEVPELGNTDKEKIDVTVLEDEDNYSIDGRGNSTQDLAFVFLLEGTQFDALCALTGSQDWKVTFPTAAGVSATFSGTPTVKMNGVSGNDALKYTLNISVNSKVVFA